jgi:alanyl-tRNA synthetase
MKKLLNEDYLEDLVNKAQKYQSYKLIIECVAGLSQNDLKNFSVRLMKLSPELISIIINKTEEGISILGMMGTKPNNDSELYIGDFIRETVEEFGGNGGGRKDYGQGFIKNKNLDIEKVYNYIKNKLIN